ncbi:hypothetical protein HN937_30520 [Candidatus Poribacteria bacterium]|nr:hypothetical protein [Candidatus Poribacteria bacterium]
MEQERVKVTIKGQEVELATPTSQSEMLAAIEIGDRHPKFAMAACLAISWPAHTKWPGGARPNMVRARYDGITLGAKVIDGLMAHGVTLAEVIMAGTAAWAMVLPLVITDEEVAAMEGFTEAAAAE